MKIGIQWPQAQCVALLKTSFHPNQHEITMAKPTLIPLDTTGILARTLWGEARGEGADGMRAVAAVILNRVIVANSTGKAYWWGNDIAAVCLRAQQFSCWNAGDANLPLLRAVSTADPAFRDALRIAKETMCGKLADPTGGATHYHALNCFPHWAEDQTPLCRIGQHVFYRLV